jgi:hypothetical protein
MQAPNWQELTQEQQAASSQHAGTPAAALAAMAAARRQSSHKQRQRALAAGDLPQGLTTAQFEGLAQPGMPLSSSVAELLDIVQGVEQHRARRERAVEVGGACAAAAARQLCSTAPHGWPCCQPHIFVEWPCC